MKRVADAFGGLAPVSVDLNVESFPENGTTYTEAFGLKALVCRCEGGYELSVERSFGDMLEDYLSRAIGP